MTDKERLIPDEWALLEVQRARTLHGPRHRARPMTCDKCGRIGQWMPRVRYGSLVLRLCRSCYESYLRAVFPDLMSATGRPIDVRSWWMRT